MLILGDWTHEADAFATDVMGIAGWAGVIDAPGAIAVPATGHGPFGTLGTFTIAPGQLGDVMTAMDPGAQTDTLVTTPIPDPGGGPGTIDAAIVARRAQTSGSTFCTATLSLARVQNGSVVTLEELVRALLQR